MGRSLYRQPDTEASRQSALWKVTDPAGAKALQRIGSQPQAVWLGEWLPDVEKTVDALVTAAGYRLCVFVVYAIPQRDGTAHSAGGMPSAVSYWSFISSIVQGLRRRKAIVILEPDALCHVDFLSGSEFAQRVQMLACAARNLAAGNAAVYIDAGDSNWIKPGTVAARLSLAGIEHAVGFATNVSHTETTAAEVAYAEQLRSALGPAARYIIDTSRNGAGPEEGPDGQTMWCNPMKARLGANPTLETGIPGCDGFLWVKRPGESDGPCNGGPPAGTWWREYARTLGGA